MADRNEVERATFVNEGANMASCDGGVVLPARGWTRLCNQDLRKRFGVADVYPAISVTCHEGTPEQQDRLRIASCSESLSSKSDI